MKIKQIYRIMERIDEKLEALTQDDFDSYCYGAGTLSILEAAIDEILWDIESIKQFWQSYQSTTYDGTPCENNIVYEILEKYFFAQLSKVYQKFGTED